MATKNKELGEMSPVELDKKIRDSQEELVMLRLRKQTGQVEKPHRITELRRSIARLKTYLKQKQDKATETAAQGVN